MQLTCVVDYADSRYSTTLRPPGPLLLPSQKQPNRNSHQYTILYVLTPDNTLVKRRAKLLHNIWRHSFPIVETTFLLGLKGVHRIIGDRFIDPKEWTNVPVPMTLVPMTLQHPTSVKNRLHFHTFLPKSLHYPNKCLTFAATVPATPLPWMRTTAGLRVFIEYM